MKKKRGIFSYFIQTELSISDKIEIETYTIDDLYHQSERRFPQCDSYLKVFKILSF